MKNTYIKSPINYIGNKYKLIGQIIPLFPEKINMFVDVFGGSGTVLINTRAEHYLYNDINPYVTSIFEGLITEDTDEVVNKIENIILEYSLSKTNKEGFEKLRDDYNNGKNDWITLYTLMCHSFNHQFRFNNQHQYNSSFGKNRSYFSDRQRKDLYDMKKTISTDIAVVSKSFVDIDYSDFDENDLLYFDPPYFNSVGNYNDGKRGFEGWTEQHEKQLLELLDKLNEQGTRFALSNNLKYDNPMLDEWKDKYKTHFLKGDYVNCNYHKIDRSKDCEVLITNY
ncbi:Dam family site-specific DNA-(adenine-N6)-methyltransferase [Eubacterium sp.]|uniref:DNA adenine methylase n=1 Tax=Eubacterium sp. TaxID=142586 RepID=UPI001DBC1F01|nr:Dam family site-specific DNA-(adenine-N6)-methyltransferase [Eubacterium sp.]MBS5619836.1 Dam family site-specific DNA-(adenine-N6)-methyltransferase [Eubacterium sp.]